MKNNKKNKKEILNDRIFEGLTAKGGWPGASLPPFRTTFIFGASQSEFYIKSYGHLKFFCPKIFETLNL